jgi:hypothetical protein
MIRFPFGLRQAGMAKRALTVYGNSTKQPLCKKSVVSEVLYDRQRPESTQMSECGDGRLPGFLRPSANLLT